MAKKYIQKGNTVMDMEEGLVPQWVKKGWVVINKTEFNQALKAMRENEQEILEIRAQEDRE